MTDRSTTLDLDAIEARASAATPGPWLHRDGPPIHAYGDRESLTSSPGGAVVVRRAPPYERDLMMVASYTMTDANAVFIAHARADIPALVARVRELEDEVARAHEQARYERSRARRTVRKARQ